MFDCIFLIYFDLALLTLLIDSSCHSNIFIILIINLILRQENDPSYSLIIRTMMAQEFIYKLLKYLYTPIPVDKDASKTTSFESKRKLNR